MAETYFHAAPLGLAPGSIIEPGNWGRIIRARPMNNGSLPTFYIQELVFESVRLREFSRLPSRLDAAFVFESMNDATALLKTAGRMDVLHEVEFVDPDSPRHRAGSNLIGLPTGDEAAIPALERHARQYWRGERIVAPEILTLSALRIVQRIR